MEFVSQFAATVVGQPLAARVVAEVVGWSLVATMVAGWATGFFLGAFAQDKAEALMTRGPKGILFLGELACAQGVVFGALAKAVMLTLVGR